MGAIPHPKLFAAIALILIGLLCYRGLVHRSRSATSGINLDDLLLDPETGKISKAAAVMMAALGVTSWLMVYLGLTGKMTEGYLGLYLGAWVVPTVTKMINDAKVKIAAQGAS